MYFIQFVFFLVLAIITCFCLKVGLLESDSAKRAGDFAMTLWFLLLSIRAIFVAEIDKVCDKLDKK